jgi:DNA-binding CsgD family transcriptional regulator
MSTALTHAEMRVLELIAAGKTSKEIAGTLRLSLHTVGNHRKHICKKLNVHSTAELVAYAATTFPRGVGRERDRAAQ